MSLPEGWTDDFNIPLPPGRTEEDLVTFLLPLALGGARGKDLERELMNAFALSPQDAYYARDRFFGGVVRAATRNVANMPDRSKDPIAWTSYHRAERDPGIIATLYPQYVKPKDTDSP